MDNAINDAGQPCYTNYLKIAIWHHAPDVYATIDSKYHDPIQRLSAAGFRIFLHGHIHVPDHLSFQPSRAEAGLLMLSAGTFAAPASQLLPARPWSYNVLYIDQEHSDATVFPRTKQGRCGLWGPLWSPLPRTAKILYNGPPFTGLVATDRTSFSLSSQRPPGDQPAPFTPADITTLGNYIRSMAREIDSGAHVLPVFGTDINLCSRPSEPPPWNPLSTFAPTNLELVNYFAPALFPLRPPPFSFTHCDIPLDHCCELLLSAPSAASYPKLREALEATQTTIYPPNRILDAFAGQAIRRHTARCAGASDLLLPFLITTAFDCCLEQALRRHCTDDGFNRLFFDSTEFWLEHWPRSGAIFSTKTWNSVAARSGLDSSNFGNRPTVLRLHSPYAYKHLRQDECLLAEDHFINFFLSEGRGLLKEVLHVRTFLERKPHVWFLGFSPSYWSDRTLLYSVFADRLNLASSGVDWRAIILRPDPLAGFHWHKLDPILTLPTECSDLSDAVESHFWPSSAR